MILLIDNYDSFTYNLYQYLGQYHQDIRVIRNDEITADEVQRLHPDYIVVSPGPKSPQEAGNCLEIIRRMAGRVPILGICLGHQSIGAAFGADISYAKQLHHGKTSQIYHDQKGIFEGISSPMEVVRYHSLAIQKERLPEMLEVTAVTADGEIMAIRHKEYPIIGLQFHPESIFTPHGKQLIENFIRREIKYAKGCGA